MKLNKNKETEEIEKEIEIMKNLEHPNILSIQSFNLGKGRLVCNKQLVSSDVTYFVMPLAGKGDLGTYLK